MTLRFASRSGRSTLIVGDGTRCVDLEQASGGRLPWRPNEAFARWAEVRDFAASCADPGVPFKIGRAHV